VEHHRANLMRKSGASSIAELVGLVASDQTSDTHKNSLRQGD
jgi:FixJ family two-component response regulator